MPSVQIPRSGSCRQSDPDYDPLLCRLLPRIDVKIFGVSVPRVIAYNCDEGWIRSLRVNQFGKVHLVHGKVMEKLLRGTVTVTMRPSWRGVSRAAAARRDP